MVLQQVSCTVEKAGAWRILFRGSSLLLEARGPASYKRYPDHHFFVKLFRNEAVSISSSYPISAGVPLWRH